MNAREITIVLFIILVVVTLGITVCAGRQTKSAVDFYAGYESYRTSCAPREIRIFRLRPLPD